jgi:undecaprenyl diphosphate synthase
MIDPATYFAPVPADIELERFDAARVPAHVAVIMDGNGRWAQAHGKPRSLGHKAGVKGVRNLIQTADDLGIRYLTIYSFSTENWARPKTEVATLMRLFAQTMAGEIDAMDAKGVRINLIGDIDGLAPQTQEVYRQAVARTAANTGMTLTIAANYGARQSIVAAIRKAAADPVCDLAALTTEGFAAYLETAGLPDPDLLIRTSGEHRLSNFLLYETAYTEFYVTDLLWPDFDKYAFLRALIDYQARSRRFGGIDG